MFQSARLKLTAWYLLIIMFVSVFFSVAIYRVLTFELNRVERVQRLRVERRFPERLRIELPRPLFLDPELITETKSRLKIILIVTNFFILGASAVAGYFLAGKTLKPIAEMVDEQRQFVADASHELRTPLTVLKTSMEVALKDKKIILGEAKKVIKENLGEVDSLISLSNNLLSLTRYQTNGQNLIFEEADIKEITQKACKKISALAKKKTIKINLKVKSQKIRVNQESLEEMLLIFLDNAVKFTPQGGRVAISTKTNKKHFVLEIADTGIGIVKEDLPHIFDRFYRADTSRSKTKVAGFGLGLSLAKRIVEIHQGTVLVKSKLAQGTTFTIKLPH